MDRTAESEPKVQMGLGTIVRYKNIPFFFWEKKEKKRKEKNIYNLEKRKVWYQR